jgi:hypothetical protein
MSKKTERSAAIVTLVLLFLAFGVWAETESEPAAAAAPAEAEASEEAPSEEELAAAAAAEEAEKLEESLRGILSAQKLVAEDLRTLQNELESDAAVGREEEITAEILALSLKLEELDGSFTEIAAGVDTEVFDVEEESEQIDLTREIRDLLGPLIKELKRVSSRPREIDRLRTEIANAEEQLAVIQSAVANLAALRESVEDRRLVSKLKSELASWEDRQQETETNLDIARQKLDQMLSERTSIGEAMQNVFQIFFRSRGRNLLLALLVTGGFLVILRRLHREAMRSGPMQQRSKTLWARVFNLLYVVFTIIGGILVFLIVLYFFGDWVLLIIVLLLIAGSIWASKQAIPKFWMQATLLLDMGPVREGERLEYDGLPFQVESLNFYTDLVNPELSGGCLRLPIGDLSDLRSRPFDEDEPWFPTSVGEWVVLSDGTYGQVAFQSIEIVDLRLKGDSHKIYATRDFLSQKPIKLSSGFRARATFGLDYGLQPVITSQVVQTLDAAVRERLEASFLGEHLLKMRVSFEEAGSSSLDLRVVADFSGEAANLYKIAPRLMQEFCVDVCNENGWTIPFRQLTLHVAPDAEGA